MKDTGAEQMDMVWKCTDIPDHPTAKAQRGSDRAVPVPIIAESPVVSSKKANKREFAVEGIAINDRADLITPRKAEKNTTKPQTQSIPRAESQTAAVTLFAIPTDLGGAFSSQD